MKREELINNIIDIQNTLYFIREETEDYTAITEYDSIYGDIDSYIYNDFDSFKNKKELEEYIKYLRKVVENYMIKRGEN